jgi:response regulator NasT
VAEGLEDLKPTLVAQAATLAEADLQTIRPDVIVVSCESPDRDTLESLRETTETNPKPVVMFVDRSSPGLAEEAIRSGVAAYVVDGLTPGRVRPVIEVAVSRFQLMQGLRTDLARAKADLAARKTIDRAKGVLMKTRGLDEDAAYKTLRKLAMDTGRPLASVAADLIAYAAALNGDSQ